MDLVRKMLLEAEKSDERYFDIGTWDWTDHDMRDTELVTKLDDAEVFHLDLLEQGGLIQKSICEHSDVQMWETTWQGYEFLDAVRSNSIWSKLKNEAEKRGIGVTVQFALRAVKEAAMSVSSLEI
ncbi:unnamed protein product [Ectocarpus sp. 12 AP-2014]